LLRHYFPKGTDLSIHSQAQVNVVFCGIAAVRRSSGKGKLWPRLCKNSIFSDNVTSSGIHRHSDSDLANYFRVLITAVLLLLYKVTSDNSSEGVEHVRFEGEILAITPA
jgi:hypothetical protein